MATAMQRSSMRGTAAFKATPSRSSVSRVALRVEANRRVQKKQQIILTRDEPNLGKEGQLLTVPVGFWRNYLLPGGMAKIANDGVLEQIRKKKEAVLRAKLEEKAQAQAFANALATIGKFVLKKRAGEKDQVFGSVTKQEVATAIYQQTGRTIEEADITVPDMKTIGSYECSAKLHPEVNGVFTIVIQKEKQASGKRK